MPTGCTGSAQCAENSLLAPEGEGLRTPLLMGGWRAAPGEGDLIVETGPVQVKDSEVIARRFTRGWHNFEHLYREHVDGWQVFDNPGESAVPLDHGGQSWGE